MSAEENQVGDEAPKKGGKRGEDKAEGGRVLSIDEIVSKASRQAEKNSTMELVFQKRELVADRTTSFGSLHIDRITGGGIPPGRIVGVAGPEGAGKSLIADDSIHCQLKAGRVAVKYDAEGTADPMFLQARGIDYSKYIGKRNKNGDLNNGQRDFIYYYQPETGQQMLQHMITIMDAMPENRNAQFPLVLFVTDSVVALIPEALQDDLDGNKTAAHARMYSEMLPLIKGRLSRTGCSWLYVNQIRLKPGQSYGSPEYEPCLVGDTRIATDHGLIKIEDCMNKDYKALTPDGVVSIESQFVYTGKKNTVILCLRNGMRIEVTPDHKVTTTDGDYQAKDCLNRRVVLTTGGCFGRELEDRDVGLLLGWTVGDGWLTDFDAKFGVCFGPDDYFAKAEVCRILADRYNICHAVRAKGEKTSVESVSSDKASIKNDFRKWGWKPAKSRGKEVPEVIFRSDRTTMAAFLGALFSADGSVRSLTDCRDCVELTTTSEELAKQTQLLLLNFSVTSKIHYADRQGQVSLPKNDGSGENAEPTDRTDYWRVVISGEAIENFKLCIGFPLSPQKQAKLQQVKWSKALDLTCEVVDIQNGVIERHVFDVKEPLTNHLQANGIITHNCGEALKFYSSMRLNLSRSKPKNPLKLDDDHPFVGDGNIIKAAPKAGGIWEECHSCEPGLEKGVGLDRYIYTAIKTIKNKVYNPFKACWMRIQFEENGSTGHGLDKVYDVFTFLLAEGFLVKATARKDLGEKAEHVRGVYEVVASAEFDPRTVGIPERFNYFAFKDWVGKNPQIQDVLREKLIVSGLVYRKTE